MAARRQVGAPDLPARAYIEGAETAVARPANEHEAARGHDGAAKIRRTGSRDPPGGERGYIAEWRLPDAGARGEIDRVQQPPGWLLARQVLAVPEASIRAERRRPAEWQIATLRLRHHLPDGPDLVGVHDQVRTAGIDRATGPRRTAHRAGKRQGQLAARRRVEPAAAYAREQGLALAP